MNKYDEYYRRDVEENNKREKLFQFASVTMIILALAAIYFEFLDQMFVPPFLRVFLALYFFYSLASVIVSKRGSDYWVSTLFFNVSR